MRPILKTTAKESDARIRDFPLPFNQLSRNAK